MGTTMVEYPCSGVSVSAYSDTAASGARMAPTLTIPIDSLARANCSLCSVDMRLVSPQDMVPILAQEGEPYPERHQLLFEVGQLGMGDRPHLRTRMGELLAFG